MDPFVDYAETTENKLRLLSLCQELKIHVVKTFLRKLITGGSLGIILLGL